MDYDVFISHASEDKKYFVRQLAKRLEEIQVLVWYDEFTLKPGNSLRRSIDLGLSKCRFGIVVLSENFFKKKWTNWELDGLVARQNSSENELIIPIWLNITRDELLNYSPSLADKVAIDATLGIDEVVSKLLHVIKPEGSTLVVARDLLFKVGLTPPLVTDDWWLDVVEYSGKEFLHHDYLSFSIPWKSWSSKDRGEYIAKHALQKLWQEQGDRILISQLTPPGEVLDFISSQPGLKETALEQPQKAAFYFPQLAIKGLGGFLESSFDTLLKQVPIHQGKHLCENEVALRHPIFGNFTPIELADFYFSGAGGGFGPPTSRHDNIDYLIWLLSSQSSWLPNNIKLILFEGLKLWGVWQWDGHSNNDSGFQGMENSGALQHALWRTKDFKKFKLTKKITLDVKERIAFSKNRLNLPENIEELYERFIQSKVIDAWIMRRIRPTRRNKSVK